MFIISLIVISAIPLKHIFKLYGIAMPFIVFTAISLYITTDFITSLSMFVRISVCLFCIMLLTSTTQFFEFLKALQTFRIPNVIVVLLMFTYRYLFVFIDELHRMKLARKARAFHIGKNLFDKYSIKIISYAIGMTLTRAYRRGVRIQNALRAKGFDGRIRTMKMSSMSALPSTLNIIFCITIISAAVLLLYHDWVVIA
jgi:cobalt/nickel transport system permease protein